MPEGAVLTPEQITEIGATVGKVLLADLSRHITDVLPEALKHHGVDLSAMRQTHVEKQRLPFADPPPVGSTPQSAAIGDLLGGGASNELRRAAIAMNGQFSSFGEFLKLSHFRTVQNHGFDPRMKVLGEGQGDQGGFLVPTEYTNRVLALALQDAIFRPRAFVMPMATNDTRIPTIRDTTHATNVFGGVQMYWTAESATITASEPTFEQMALVAQKLAGYTSASNELLADNAVGLEALLVRLFGQAVGFFEDDAFFNGDGAGKPIGVLNADALVSVSAETNQAATTLVVANLDKMFSRMLPSSQNRAIWVAHTDVFPQLAALSRDVGTGGSAVWMANVAGGPPTTIYGRPVIFTEHCQTLGTVGDIYFMDPSYYVIGDRQAMSIMSSPHPRFANDETVWRITERLAGRPWLDSALTPRHGSNSYSPFVALATRS